MTTTTLVSNRVAISITRWTARVLGLLASLFFLILIVGETVQTIQEEELAFEPEALFVIIPTLFAVVSYIISWWHEKTGGWLLILAYFIFSLSPTILSIIHGDGIRIYLATFVVSLPFLIAGILFLVSHYLSHPAAN